MIFLLVPTGTPCSSIYCLLLLNSVLVLLPAVLHTLPQAGLLPATAPLASTAAFHTLGRGGLSGTGRAAGATLRTKLVPAIGSAR